MRVAEGGARGRSVPYLRAWRMYRALSLADLARRAQVSLSTIERGERAGHPALSWESIRRVAEALSIRPDQLWSERPPNGGHLGATVEANNNGDASGA